MSLLNIIEACISITGRSHYQVLNEKLDSRRKNHCTVGHHSILLCLSSYTVVEIYAYFRKLGGGEGQTEARI